MPAGAIRSITESRAWLRPDDGPADGSQDVYLSVREIARSGILALKRGDRISFKIEERPGERRPAAVGLKLLERAQP